jgi:hypothetical protein
VYSCWDVTQVVFMNSALAGPVHARKLFICIVLAGMWHIPWCVAPSLQQDEVAAICLLVTHKSVPGKCPVKTGGMVCCQLPCRLCAHQSALAGLLVCASAVRMCLIALLTQYNRGTCAGCCQSSSKVCQWVLPLNTRGHHA